LLILVSVSRFIPSKIIEAMRICCRDFMGCIPEKRREIVAGLFGEMQVDRF
jgi:hypothetical protein